MVLPGVSKCLGAETQATISVSLFGQRVCPKFGSCLAIGISVSLFGQRVCPKIGSCLAIGSQYPNTPGGTEPKLCVYFESAERFVCATRVTAQTRYSLAMTNTVTSIHKSLPHDTQTWAMTFRKCMSELTFLKIWKYSSEVAFLNQSFEKASSIFVVKSVRLHGKSTTCIGARFVDIVHLASIPTNLKYACPNKDTVIIITWQSCTILENRYHTTYTTLIHYFWMILTWLQSKI